MKTAPIALFVYDRIDHTMQTIESLKKNAMAAESELFIFSDGPKDKYAEESVRWVREFINKINGFKSVTISEKDRNYGLAASIIAGVTEICNRYGRVIVLEDDLILSPYFLKYMNDALEYYDLEPRVAHISGSLYPIDAFRGGDTFFLRIPLCWGWATWKRAWDMFEKNIEIMKRFNWRMIARFNFNETYPYWIQLELNRSGIINTWFIFWYANVFLSNSLVLFPRRSLVKNIGNDGTGMHCAKTEDYDVDLSSGPIRVSPVIIEESNEAFRLHKKYFRSISPVLYLRILQIKRIAASFLEVGMR